MRPKSKTSRISVSCQNINVSLDHVLGDVCYVSHAHSDHVSRVNPNKEYLCSKETLALVKAKFPASAREVKTASIDGIRLHKAGHILGATQFEFDSFVYSGDFCLDDSLVCKGAEVVKCDTLVVDATYGEEEHIFPERSLVYGEMEEWVLKQIAAGRNVVFGGYSLGKSQELVKFLNDFCKITPLVHPEVEKFCNVYNELGVGLKRVPLFTEDSEQLLRDGFVAVMPQHMVNKMLTRDLSKVTGRETVCSIASGWAISRNFFVDKSFALSDHADFNGVVNYVRESGAKKVFLSHGRGTGLTKRLAREGVSVEEVCGHRVFENTRNAKTKELNSLVLNA